MFYGTVTGADSYHAARGSAAWDGLTNSEKEIALTRASQYIDGAFRYVKKDGTNPSMFCGRKTEGRTQELEWPRTGACDSDGEIIPSDSVPREIEYATYEAALREAETPGYLSPDFVPSDSVSKEKVGPIEVQYANATMQNGETPNRPIIPVVKELVGPLICARGDWPGIFTV